MPDVFKREVRSAVMAAIKSRGNQRTEQALAKILRLHSITGWRRHQNLPGRPDFVFPRNRVAVFVDGCFWHNCPKHGRKPDSNQVYWHPKLERNRMRDKRVNRELRQLGWRVVRFWEHSLTAEKQIVRRLTKLLTAQPCEPSRQQSPVRKRPRGANSRLS
jgi:DNA mismatch endonuclease (patch repair protein)